jgi:glycerol-3-phosphate dehydrogenase (NAD(P)+)
MKLVVMGAGAWGTTFAKVLADGDNDVMVWARREDVADEINKLHRNGDYLPGVRLPQNLRASNDPEEVLAGATQVYLAVPSQALRDNLLLWGQFIPKDAILVSLMKGVEKETGLRMSEVMREILGFPEDQIVVVSGPNLSLEIAAEEPAASVAACSSIDNASQVASVASNTYFTTFTNKHRIRWNPQEPDRGCRRHRQRCRLRPKHQGIDHHPRPCRDLEICRRLRRKKEDHGRVSWHGRPDRNL